VVVFGFSWLQLLVYRRVWSRNLWFELHSSSPAVFEGEKVTLTDSLKNANRLPLPWIHVTYRLSQDLVYLDADNNKTRRGERNNLLLTVGVNKAVTRKTTVICEKRGCYQASSVLISCNNLLMTHYETEKREIGFCQLVYPKIVDYPEAMIPFMKMLGDVPVKRFIDPDPFTFRGVREYQPYDAFRQINWNAAAKTGLLMTNICDFTVTQDITVILNLQKYGKYNRNYVFEEAIRIAAFYCRRCLGMGIPVSLVCPARDGKPMRIAGGLSKAHLETIYAAFAYIDLTKWNASVIDYIPAVSDRAVVLISSYHERDIQEKFLSLRERSAGSFWVIPFSAGDEVLVEPDSGILKLEVRQL